VVFGLGKSRAHLINTNKTPFTMSLVIKVGLKLLMF